MCRKEHLPPQKAFWLTLKIMLMILGAGGFGLRAAGGDPAADAVANETNSPNKSRPSARLELDSANVVVTGQFLPGAQEQEIIFDHPVMGQYFCLETLSALDGRPYAAVAEINLLDQAGHLLSRTNWTIAYADSEEHDREDGSADNVLDNNPNTVWHTQWNANSPNHPHHLVLDLGQHETLSGFRYLPRQGRGALGGRIKDYRFYVGDNMVEAYSPNQELPAKCYLMSYFTGDGTEGLHLAYSLNGYRWEEINRGQPLLPPLVGGKLMRDPCLLLAPDGTFHLVWTADWTGNYFGYAASKDLLHWSAQSVIPVMAAEPTALNCWAPEAFWDASRQDFLVFWASTVTARTGWTGRPDNNRIYGANTRDFKTFSPTRLLFDPGSSVIDATLLTVSNYFNLVYKDEKNSHLRMVAAAHPDGPFGLPGPVLETDNAEGPTAFWLSSQAVVFYHVISGDRCGAVKSADLQHWDDISSGVVFPPGCHQSTVLEVPGEKLKPLLQAGILEAGTTAQASELGIGDWIWTTNVTDRQSCRLWRGFDIPGKSLVARAELRMTADNSYTAYLDGREIGRGGDANSLAEYDLTLLMSPGHHVLAVEAFNDTLDAGVIAGLHIKLADGHTQEIYSNPTWRIAPGNVRNWQTREVAGADWLTAQVVGYAGKAWWRYPRQIIQVPPLIPSVVHFWQKGWFLVVLVTVCLLVVVLWLRMGLQLALQTRADRLLERERARIARDIHDDLGSGLTQLTLLGELVLREDACQGETRNRLSKLCVKARTLLHSMDEIVWAVNPQRDTVKDFSAFIAEHAQEYLASTSIRCRQEMPAELPSIPMNLPQRRNLMLAVKEAIRNAARHSGADEVKLMVEVIGNSLRVVVEDNGHGLAPAAAAEQSGRNGMTNMKQRLADIGGSFEFHSVPGQGCRATFLMPLTGRERLKPIKL